MFSYKGFIELSAHVYIKYLSGTLKKVGIVLVKSASRMNIKRIKYVYFLEVYFNVCVYNFTCSL